MKEDDTIARYKKAVAYLDGLANIPRSDDYMSGRSRPGIFLKRTKALLDMLGNPERRFKYVHITGTAGKGTVTTMVHESLSRAGKRVGSFTSPFVVAAIEKIRVNELYIAPREFVEIVDALKPLIDRMHQESPLGRPSYFEIYFAIALMYFEKMQCEWVVLEVGAGGRYDATNIIEHPVVTAITGVDYDHTQILGKTLRRIARNKAGILKKDSVFFTTEKRPVLLTLFKQECRQVGASFNALPVSDDYRINNETLARAICSYLGLSSQHIQEGIETTKLPCRFETISERPGIVLDGAHNRAKMRSTISNVKHISYKKLHLVIGMNAKKDARTMVREIAPYADYVYATRFRVPSLSCADPKDLAAQAQKSVRKGALVSAYLDASDALTAARKNAAPEDLILVTGSFYLAGELRSEWYSEDWILNHRKSFA